MLGSFLIPVLIVFVFAAFVSGLMLWAKRYIKVPPDQVAIITGATKKIRDENGKVVDKVGYRIVRGGATFVWPIREMVQYLPLTLMTLPVIVKDAPNKDGVKVSIEVVANVKVKGEDKAIAKAVECFLKDPSKVKETVTETLEGQLRSIVGTMTIEELNQDRKTFEKNILEAAVSELEKMGIEVKNIPIKRVSDEVGYIDALGKKRTAEVKRDAEIGQAQATAEAKKKSSEAIKEAEMISAENERAVAEAHKNRDIKKAEYDADVNRQQAIAAQAGPRAQAEAEKAVMVAKEEAKAAQTEAAGRVQIEEAKRKEQELLATTIKQADANKQAAIVNAEGAAKARTTKAEAEKTAMNDEAEGEAAKIKKEGEATAYAIKVKLLAEAEGIKAKLLAEAEGKDKLAEALKKLNETGQLLFLMQESPEVIKALGEAGERIARGVFEPVGNGVGQIDAISVYDSGSGNGQGAMERATDIVPAVVFNFLQKCKANGMTDIGDILTNLVKNLNAKLSPPAVVGEVKTEALHELEKTSDRTVGGKPVSKEVAV